MILSHRKALCARVAYWDALASRHRKIAGHTLAAAAMANIWNDVQTATWTEMANPQDTVGLAKFVEGIGADVQRRSAVRARALTGVGATLVADAGRKVQARTRDLPCPECADTGTGCMEARLPFERTFELAMRTATDYYARFAKLEHAAEPPEYYPYYAARQEDLNDFGFAASGMTLFPGSKRKSTVVELGISIENFGLCEFLAFPYVLFHECICHVFQRLVPQAKNRENREDDLFSEGWMDWIAMLVLDDVLGGAAPLGPAAGALCLSHGYERTEAVGKLHAIRTGMPGSGSSRRKKAKYAAQRGIGVAGARSCGALLRKVAPAKGRDAGEVLYQLSFDLNLSSAIPTEDKERLANEFYMARNRNGPHASLVRKLSKYCVSNDLRDIV